VERRNTFEGGRRDIEIYPPLFFVGGGEKTINQELECRIHQSKEGHGGNRDVVVMQETEVAAGDHKAGKSVHFWVCLEVKVTEHFIRLPPTNKFDNVGIHLGTKQCHSTTST
jgi:hypothetical protein